MYKTKSLPSKLNCEGFYIRKEKSFDNFNDLILKGDLKYMSYGQYLMENQDTTRIQRQRALKNHFYNYKFVS